MRVLHFCEQFSALSETFIFDLLTELEQQVGDQHVVTPRRELEEDRPFPCVHLLQSRARWNPQRLAERVAARLGSMSLFESNWSEMRRGLTTTIGRVRPALLHAHFGRPGVIAAPVARKAGVPLIVSFYGYDASELLEKREWVDPLSRLLRDSAAIVVLSSQMRDRLVDFGATASRVHLVHLGKRISDYAFAPSRKVRRFLSIGRMVDKKGHFDSIAAFREVAERHADVHLDIVGDGPLLSAVEGHVAALGLVGRVTLHGACPHDRVKELFGAADAFVLCSKRAPDGDCEGTPTVLLEAQAVGLPCVSTLHAGIPETVPPENRFLLAPEGDVRAIAHRMNTLAGMGPPELCTIAQAGRLHMCTEFNVAIEAGKLVEVYRALC